MYMQSKLRTDDHSNHQALGSKCQMPISIQNRLLLYKACLCFFTARINTSV